MRKTIVEYDYVRAVAVLLVILGHCSYYAIMTDYGGVSVDIPHHSRAGGWIGLLTATLYSFHMPLFISLSGCLFAYTVGGKGLQPFAVFVKKKAVRLLLPFLGTALFWSVPLKLVSGYWHGLAWEIARQIFVGQILMAGNFNSHLWFLQALFWVFVMAYIIERYRLRRNAPLFLLALLALSMAGRYAEGHRLCFLNVQAAAIYLFWFYAGFYFERHREATNTFIRKHVPTIITIAALLAYPLIVIMNGRIPSLTKHLSYYLVAIYGMTTCYALCLKLLSVSPPRLLSIVNKISNDSYGLYLYSDPVNYVIIYAVYALGLSDMFAVGAFEVGMFLFRFAITTLVAWAVIRIVRDVKLSRR